MDLSFLRQAEARFASPQPVAIDYGLLVRMLRAHQAQSLAARADAAMARRPELRNPLAELLLGGADWRDAVSAQRGSFNPAYARSWQPAVN